MAELAELAEEGATPAERLVDEFCAAHARQWGNNRRWAYRSVLVAFAQHFGTLPSEPEEIIAWVWDLAPCFGEFDLAPGTRQDYYDRIKYLYGWLKANAQGGERLPELKWTPKGYWKRRV